MSKNAYYGNRQIARLLLLAHEANLRAKHKEPFVKMPEMAVKDFYTCKLNYFMHAIKLIQNMKNSDFTFWVETAEDQNGYPSIITYFELKRGKVKNNGVEHQIQLSFHTPLNLAPKELIKLVQKGKPTIWTRIIGDYDSIIYLKQQYDIISKDIIDPEEN